MYDNAESPGRRPIVLRAAYTSRRRSERYWAFLYCELMTTENGDTKRGGNAGILTSRRQTAGWAFCRLL